MADEKAKYDSMHALVVVVVKWSTCPLIRGHEFEYYTHQNHFSNGPHLKNIILMRMSFDQFQYFNNGKKHPC